MSRYGFMDAWKAVDPAISIGKRIVLHRTKGQLIGLCPFHPDTEPSLGVWRFSDGTGAFKCFSCGAVGNTAQFVQRVDGISFDRAVLLVMREARAAKENGQVTPAMDYSTSTETVIFPMSSVTCQECRQRDVKPHSHYIGAMQSLETSAAGQEWLAKRGIGMAIARKFCIGFVQDALQAVGEHHPWRRDGWILFPILSADRQTVTCVKYRSLVAKKAVIDGETVIGIRCVSSPSMFNLLQTDLSGDVWICEGEPDCLVLAQAGVQAASIVSAAVAPSERECEMLSSAKRIFLAGDNDDGVGTKAMIDLRQRLHGETHFIRWANGCKDANDVLTNECGNDPEKFKALIREMETAQLTGVKS